MSIRLTYFVHGTTTHNETGTATGWSPGELSERGIQESRNLGPMVQDQNFDIVFCSDLKRAIDTSNLAFGEKYTIVQDARLRECNYGDNTGKPSRDFKSDMKKNISVPFPNGESYQDVENRVRDFVNFLKKEYDGKHVAIVAHEGSQFAFDVILKDKTWEQAIDENWRKVGKWQPGWEYKIS